MELELWAYLVVCPLVFLAGLIDGIAGGGGLISVPAYMFAGLPVHFALGTNKLSSTIGTAIAAWRYYKSGFMDIALCVPCVAAALLGAPAGAMLALGTGDEILQKVLLVLLPVIAIYVFKNKNFDVVFGAYSRKKTLILAMLVSFLVGMYDGFFGPGTGTFLILLYMGVAKINPRAASGNAKLVNLSSNLSALAIFFYNGYVLLTLGLIAGAFGVLGNYIGAGLAIKKSSNIIRYAILLVLALLFTKLAWDILAKNI